MKRSLFFYKTFVIIICFSLAVISTSCNIIKQAAAEEKISFSHKTHVEKYNIKDCGTCHKYDVNKNFRGFPTIGECTVCHDRNGELTGTDHMTPRKKTIFDSYTDKDKPWVSGSKDEKLVYYSHKVVMTTELKDGKTIFNCGPCHADKVNSAGIAKIKGGKLMDQCIKCHTSYNMNNQCDVCHR